MMCPITKSLDRATYHHLVSTSSNLRAERHDSSKYISHSIYINPLIGLLPATLSVNNCWADREQWRENTVHMPPTNVSVSSWWANESRNTAFQGKMSLSGHGLRLQAKKSQVSVMVSPTYKTLRCAVTSYLCGVYSATFKSPTHQVAAWWQMKKKWKDDGDILQPRQRLW